MRHGTRTRNRQPVGGTRPRAEAVLSAELEGGPVIALDARLVGYAAGIARYAVLLADALRRLEGPERYVILRGRKAARFAIHGPNVETHTVFTPPHNRLERLVTVSHA